MKIRRARRRVGLIALPLAAALALGPVQGAAAQPAGPEIPSVGMSPVGTTTDGPNRGQWFILALEPGRTGRGIAKITNPAPVAQSVKLYLRDLVFDGNDNPEVVDGEQTGVGAWGRFEVSEALVPAKGSINVVFAVTPPEGADPGDHVGVAVAESAPSGGDISVIKRVATRVYVTLPGEAKRDLRIDSMDVEAPGFWPRSAEVTVELVNTGNARLRPRVTVGEAEARGAGLLMSHSSETYFGKVRVPFYGGPVRVPVDVETDGGIVRRGSIGIFVIPWGLFVLLAVVIAGGVGAAVLWRRRFSRVEAMRRELALVQEMVAKGGRPAGEEQPRPVSGVGFGGRNSGPGGESGGGESGPGGESGSGGDAEAGKGTDSSTAAAWQDLTRDI